MDSNSKELYLMSSNASDEYVLDILETLALPFGTVQHFRYRLEWLDDELKAKLPQEEGKQENELRGMRVVICYLYQQKSNEQYEWKAVYPIRTGILVDGHRSGDTKEDIAHFYFQVDNYILYGNDDFIRLLQNVSGEKWGKRYAFLGQGLGNANIAKKEESKSAFHKICLSLKSEHFSSVNRGRKECYCPVFYFIDGIKNEKGKFLMPEYKPLSYQSFYKLAEGSCYTFQLSTYLPYKPPPFTIRLLSDGKLFSTPSEYELKVSSPYDEQSWILVSSLLERDAWTNVSLKSELGSDETGKKPLNPCINFAVLIKRKCIYRIIDAASDIGFGIGTGAIALSKIIDAWTWWYWPVIGGYAMWGICKVMIKVWRG